MSASVSKTAPTKYLHIIECKDRGRPIEQKEIAAFVTIIEETHANRGTFVSAVGFQKGAIELGRKRGVDLYTLEEIPVDWSDKVLLEIRPPTLLIRRLRIRRKADSRWLDVPDVLAPGFSRTLDSSAGTTTF